MNWPNRGGATDRIRIKSNGSLANPKVGDIWTIVLGKNIVASEFTMIQTRNGTPTTLALVGMDHTVTSADIPAIGGSWPLVANANNLTLQSTPVNVTNPPTVPATPVAPVLTALAESISVAYTVPANGGSTILEAQFLDINGVATTLTGSPQTIAKAAGSPITGVTRFRNAVGWSDYSPQSNSVTPTLSQPKLAALNYLNPNIAETFASVSAIRGRTIYRTPSDPTTDGSIVIPRFSNGNSGDVAADACTAAYTLEYNGQWQSLKRNGSTVFNLAAGEEDVITDPIDWTQFGITDGVTPVNADVYIRYEEVYAGPSARYILGAVVAHDPGNSCVGYIPANVSTMSPVNGTGPMTITGTGLNTRTRGVSVMLIGRPVNPATYKALGLYGASQARGGTDPLDGQVTASGSGWLRTCVSPTRRIAGGKCATAGNILTNMTGANNKTHWFFKYITDLVLDIGGNDLGALNGSTDRTKYAAVEKDILLLCDVIRAASPGIHIIGLPKLPCIVSSPDNFATIENQVAGTEWGASNGTSGTTTGRGQLFRIWVNEQVNTSTPGTFTGVISNTTFTVTGVDPAKRRPAIGDVVTATGYVGEIRSISANADQDGNGTYSVLPAVPAGLSSRPFTCAVAPGKGFDFSLKGATYPGRDDLWALASDTSWGLPGGAAIGVPAGSEGTGYNHQLGNQYEASSKRYLGPYLGLSY